MYAAVRHHEYAVQVRWLARTMAIVLFVFWIAFVVAEAFRPRSASWPVALYVQGAILAVIFAGYALGWRKEFLGGLLAILGTAAFLAVLAFTEALPRDPNMAWFAVPGVLYLLARHYDHRSGAPAT
jgi:hypothetical protein